MAIRRFEEVVAPRSIDEFLHETYGRSPSLMEGPSSRFARLLSWQDLGSILSFHHLEFPRLRLARAGRTLPPVSYTDTENLQRTRIRRLRPASFNENLRNGATLVIELIDELHEPIRLLAADFEKLLREHVTVNLYASWSTTPGFDLHWDPTDIFALQITGRKNWRVYEPSRRWPLMKDTEPNRRPSREPTVDYVVGAGDVLYIPRGWFHEASTVGEPSLHLAFSVPQRTGIDLLLWITDLLRSDDRFRRDLPRFTSAVQRQEFAKQLYAAITEVWQSDLLDRFFEDQDGKALARPNFSLPWSVANTESTPLKSDTLIWLTTSRPRLRISDDQNVEILGDGRRWVFAAAAGPLLKVLIDGEPHSMGDLLELSDENLDRMTVEALISELCQEGLIGIL